MTVQQQGEAAASPIPIDDRGRRFSHVLIGRTRQRLVFFVAALSIVGACAGSIPSDDDGSALSPDERAFADGMIARCNEGGYSDNTKFSATCSSAGDVAEWLGEFGRCGDGRIIALNEDSSCRDNDGFEEVLAPGYVPSAGPDDVARCSDGTFSSNTDFSGTCSSSGDVDEWLADYVECANGDIVRLDEDTDCDGGISGLAPDYAPTTSSTTTTTTTSTTITAAPPSIVPLADPEIASTTPPTTAAPATTSSTTTTTTAPPPPPPAPTNVSYQNCDAVRAAGAAPIYRGDPGYSSKLDRDGDGIGCE